MSLPIKNFSERLQEVLNEYNMRPVDLANKTGIGKSSISHYLNGSHEPTIDRVYRIAQALGVDEAWLMGYDVPMKKSTTMINESVSELGMGLKYDINITNEEEVQLLMDWRNADEQTKAMVKRLLAYKDLM